MSLSFYSADQALRWAYNTTARPVLKLSSIYTMRGPAATYTDMTPHERRAQAAQIQGVVDGMESLDAAYVHANYGREISEQEYDLIVGYCEKALTPIRARRGIILLCSEYMGQHVGWRSLRSSLSCRNNDVPVIRDRIFSELDTVHQRVIGYLDMRFRVSGLIEGASE